MPVFTDSYTKALSLPNLFSLQLCDAVGSSNRLGTMVIGGTVDSLHVGSFFYTPVVQSAWFVIGVTAFVVGDTRWSKFN